jgi:L-asparaginase
MRRPVIVLLVSLAVTAASVSARQPATKPIVYVLSTGGTIAGSGSSSTDLSNYKPGAILGEQLVKAVPQIAAIADVRVEQIVNVRSSDITIANWLTLAKRIQAILKETPAVAGFVITSGTNTLEETAYFMNLTIRSDKPVVLVGAMRPATAISADGPLNLLNAVKTAIAPESRGKGTLIVMNDEINSARDTTKTNTLRVETFRAPELGILGYVDEDKVSYYRATTKRHTANSEFDVSSLTTLPKVTILYSYIEPDATLIHAAIKSGAKGLVIAGTGNGTLSIFEADAVKEVNAMPAAIRPAIVRASRVGNGRVTPTTEFDAMNIVPSDTLTPQKARILLMLALTKTSDPKELRRIFAEY